MSSTVKYFLFRSFSIANSIPFTKYEYLVENFTIEFTTLRSTIIRYFRSSADSFLAAELWGTINTGLFQSDFIGSISPAFSSSSIFNSSFSKIGPASPNGLVHKGLSLIISRSSSAVLPSSFTNRTSFGQYANML